MNKLLLGNQPVLKRYAALTPRETQVLRLTMDGQSHEQIALQLGVSIRTVPKFRRRIFDKYGVDNVTALLSIIIRDLEAEISFLRERA